MSTKTDELMRLADSVVDAGTQMLPAVEIARRLAAFRAAIQEVVDRVEKAESLIHSIGLICWLDSMDKDRHRFEKGRRHHAHGILTLLRHHKYWADPGESKVAA